MGLRLYADECVDGRVVAGIRRRGVDVVTAADEHLLGASDGQQMERATALGRVILTADEDFFVIVRDRFAREVSFPGLMFLKPHTDIGRAIRAIVHSTEAIDSDAQNWVKWLPQGVARSVVQHFQAGQAVWFHQEGGG